MSSAKHTGHSAEPGNNDDLLRVALLLHGLTRDLTAVVARPLGPGLGSNRPIQLLLGIHHAPGITASALARSLNASNSSISRSLAPMFAAGVIRQVRDKRDGRVHHLLLTPKGRRRVLAFERRLREHFLEIEPVVKEILTLLCAPLPQPGGEPAPPLETAAGMARAGLAYTQDVRAANRARRVHERTDRFALLLLRVGPVRPCDLADQIGLSSSGIFDLVNRLESHRLARRRAGDLDDGRGVLIELTSRGADAVEAEIAVLERHAAALAASLEPILTTARREG